MVPSTNTESSESSTNNNGVATTTAGGEMLYVNSGDKDIGELYRNEEELSRSLKIGIQEQSTQTPNLEAKSKANFQAILACVSPNHSKKTKELASQFIPKYSPYFPSLTAEVINKQLDLCEDDDRFIRINALKGLPKLCQQFKDNVSQIAIILTQLLKEEDPIEAQVVRQGLNELIEIDTKSTVMALLQQIANPTTCEYPKEGDILREKTVDYLSEIMKKKRSSIQSQLQDEGTQKLIVIEIEKILGIFSSSTFSNKEKEAENMRLFLSLVSKLKSFENDNVKWTQFLKTHCPVDLEQSLDLKNDADKWKLRKFISFLRAAKSGMAQQKDNSPYFPYLMEHIFPALSDLQATTNNDDDQLRVDTLKIITEIAHCTSEYYSRTYISTIYKSLLSEIPEKSDSTKLNLSNIECYLFLFHQLALKAQGSLNQVCGIKIITGQPTDNYGDFRNLRQEMIQRLTVLETITSPYVEKIRASLNILKKQGKEENRDRIRIESQIGNCVDNILELTRALKKKNPDFISTYKTRPSWIYLRKKIKSQKRKLSDGKDKQGKNKIQKKEQKQPVNQNIQKDQKQRGSSSNNNRSSGRGGRGRGIARGGKRN